MKKLALVILGALIASRGACESYVATHSNMVDKWMLSLPAKVEGKPYVMAGLALEILRVRVDGMVQKPESFQGVADTDWSAYPFPVHAVVYRIGSELLVHRWVNGNRQGDPLLVYKLPCTARRIDIQYKIHLPDGKSSDEITLTSYELNTLEGRDKIQANKPLETTR